MTSEQAIELPPVLEKKVTSGQPNRRPKNLPVAPALSTVEDNPEPRNPEASHSAVKRLVSKDVLRGNGKSNQLVKAAPKGRNWIWIGGLDAGITPENILTYAKERWPDRDLLCYDLKSKNPKKSFKFESSDVGFDDLLHPEAWPEGLLIRRFQLNS